MGELKRRYRRHSIELKLEIIRLYESGYGSVTLSKRFDIEDHLILKWVEVYRSLGVAGLEKHGYTHNSAAFKQEAVREVIEKSLSCQSVALRYGVSCSSVEVWVAKVRNSGYGSLAEVKRKGRPPKDMGRPKKKEPQTEVEKLQEELRYLRAENAYLKKLRALVEERIARESGKLSKPSKD